MARLVKLADPSGDPLWVNPDHVVTLEWDDNEHFEGHLTRLVFTTSHRTVQGRPELVQEALL